MAGLYEDLREELREPEFAENYGAEVAKSSFGAALFNIRKSLKLTQGQLAEKLGVKQPYIAKLESGEANPTLEAIGRLFATLGYRLDARVSPLFPEETNEIYPNYITVQDSNIGYTYFGQLPSITVVAVGSTAQMMEKSNIPKEFCVSATACVDIGGSIQ